MAPFNPHPSRRLPLGMPPARRSGLQRGGDTNRPSAPGAPRVPGPQTPIWMLVRGRRERRSCRPAAALGPSPTRSPVPPPAVRSGRSWSCGSDWGWACRPGRARTVRGAGLSVGGCSVGVLAGPGRLLTLSFDVCVPLFKQEQPPGHRYSLSLSLLCASRPSPLAGCMGLSGHTSQAPPILQTTRPRP